MGTKNETNVLDTISRQAAIYAIDVLKRNYPSSCFEDLSKAVDIAIKALSAQPEREKGKWERHFSRPNVYADLCWHCSVCGGSFAYDWANKWNFCPDCGAKMDGKEAEDAVH